MRRFASLLLLLVVGCGAPQGKAAPKVDDAPTPIAATAPAPRGVAAAPEASETGLRRDLRIDEGLGGHTLTRHVGRSDEELLERLRRERDISAASTYPDRATAERVVGRAVGSSQSRIEAWARRRGARPNLVLHYVAGGAASTGRVMMRGSRQPREAGGALVVLRWDEEHGRWFVLTSYPELAR